MIVYRLIEDNLEIRTSYDTSWQKAEIEKAYYDQSWVGGNLIWTFDKKMKAREYIKKECHPSCSMTKTNIGYVLNCKVYRLETVEVGEDEDYLDPAIGEFKDEEIFVAPYHAKHF